MDEVRLPLRQALAEKTFYFRIVVEIAIGIGALGPIQVNAANRDTLEHLVAVPVPIPIAFLPASGAQHLHRMAAFEQRLGVAKRPFFGARGMGRREKAGDQQNLHGMIGWK
jgi:hypothetical protein